MSELAGIGTAVLDPAAEQTRGRRSSYGRYVGGKVAGAYLEQLGRTDMAQLSRVEWAEFCERLTRGYLEALQRQADAQVPF